MFFLDEMTHAKRTTITTDNSLLRETLLTSIGYEMLSQFHM